MKTKNTAGPRLLTNRMLPALLTALALTLLVVPRSEAQRTWTGGNAGAWLTTGNWSGSAIPIDTTVATFTNTDTRTVGLNLNTSNTIIAGSLLLSGNGTVSLSNSSTAVTADGQLRLFGTGTTNLIVNDSTSGHLILTNGTSRRMDLQLGTSGTINVSNSAAQVTIFSIIKEDSGETNGLTKTGAGMLTIGGPSANTYSGLTTLSAGALHLNKTAGQNVSAGNFNVTGGTLSWLANNQMADTTALTNAGGTVNFGGFTDTIGSYVHSSGTFTNGTITASTYSVSGGTVAGSFGAGALTVSGNSTLTGTSSTTTANITNSSLTLGSTGRLNGTTTVGTAGILQGTGSVSNLIVSGTINPGAGVGTLTAGSTVFNGGGAFNLEMFNWTGSAGTAWDLLTITSNLTLSNTVGSPFTINLISLSSTTTPGNSINFNPALSYSNTFITYSGSLLGEAFSPSLFSINTGSYSNAFTGTFSIANTGSGLALVYTALAVSDYNWSAGSGAWTTGGNWTNGVSPTNGSSIVFSGAGGNSTNDAISSVIGINFTNGAGSYVISGNALTLGSLGVVNNSSVVQTLSNNLVLGSSQNFSAAAGDLAVSGGVDLGANALTVAGGQNTTISGVVTGAGAVAKSGTGTLTLSGANDYSGGTTVSGGRLVGSTGSIQGNILNNAAVTFDQGSNGTYAGNVTGTGSLRKAGAGTVTLGGANTYGGGTEVAAGGLIGTTASLQGAITNNGTVGFEQNTNGSYAGAMTGNGSVAKTGTGTVTLGGVNTYSGGTLVTAGGLIGTTTSLQGAITNNGTVGFEQNTSGSYAGAMTGNGSVAKTGTGTVTLGGANTYSGGTLVSAGGLIGTTTSLQGNITNNGTVGFDQTTNGIYSGELSGSGSLAKSGAGSVTLSASNSYVGGTTVGGGALVVATNNALGTGTVAVTNGTVAAKDGVTIGNAFTIGTAAVNSTNFGATTVLAGWNMNGLLAGATNASVTTVASGVSGQTMSLGTGVTNGVVANALGGAGWIFTTADGAISNNSFVTYGLSASTTNSVLRLSTLNPFVYRASSTGPTNATLQYSLNGGANYTDLFTTNGFARNSSTLSYNSIDVSSGGTLLQAVGTNGVVFRWVNYGSTSDGGTWYVRDATGDDLVLNGQVGTIVNIAASGTGTLGIEEAGSANFTGNVTINNTATLTAATGGTATFSGILSGPGSAMTKTGDGTVTLAGAGANTFSGTTTVSAGTLKLDKTATNTAAIAGNLVVNSGATLLLSKSEQVANTSAVTLSGGTIVRGGDVNETFGNLTLTAASTLDYGTGGAGNLQFGTFAPSSLNKLTIENFAIFNTLKFSSDLTAFINASFTGTSFSNDYFTINGITEGFTSSFSGGTFTITSVPEPSTYVAAAGLLALMGWPMRRRLAGLISRKA